MSLSDCSLNISVGSPQHSTESKLDFLEEVSESDLRQSSPMTARKRTRASAEQLAVLEDTFAVNVSPNSKLRKQLADQLQMSERSIQIWFQNRRAKVKHMQKRAQIQMQQASIRAQLYHYNQQQHGMHPYGGPSLMPLPQQPPPPLHPYHPLSGARMALPRAQSVDAIQHPSMFTNARQFSTPGPTPYYTNTIGSPWPPYPNPAILRQSMPPNLYPPPPSSLSAASGSGSGSGMLGGMLGGSSSASADFPDYIQGQMSPSPSPQREFNAAHYPQAPPSLDPTFLPTLVSVPNTGPTAMLSVQEFCPKEPNTPVNTPPHSNQSTLDTMLWPSSSDTSRPSSTVPTLTASLSDYNTLHSAGKPNITALDPSLTATLAKGLSENKAYLNATTLIIGTWHRLRLRTSDLLCVYEPDQRQFAWYITDSNCHFKMVVALKSVANIEYVPLDDQQADVHFDMNEPPLFYMESTHPDTSSTWIQCSDFTEEKQASRFFRHTLKGMVHTLKNELLVLIHQQEDLYRLTRFVEHTHSHSHHSSHSSSHSGSHPSLSHALSHSHSHSQSHSLVSDSLLMLPEYLPEQPSVNGYWEGGSSLPLPAPIFANEGSNFKYFG